MKGNNLKHSALATLETTRSGFILRGRRALLQTLLALGNATADDVRDMVRLPSTVNPKLFGAVPIALVKLGIIAPDGYRPSARPDAHARPISVWRLTDRRAAEQWLQDNPEPAVEHGHRPERQGSLFDTPGGSAVAEGW